MAALGNEGFARFDGYQTWYCVHGDLASAKLPLILAHGGPGLTHDYLENLATLADDGRPVILYDQIGSGRSTHLPGKGADFWTVELFLRELNNLIDHLEIGARYGLLGQSWGGMLGAEHAVRRPTGLKALILANAPASMELWGVGTKRLRDALPEQVRTVLMQHELLGSYDHPDYVAATRLFYDRHFCRIAPWPDAVERSFAALAVDPTVYACMNGPNEFHTLGTLKTWSVIDRLPQIVVPTLVIRGAHDEATEECVGPLVSKIPVVEYEVFQNSSHVPHLEEESAFCARVRRFLAARE